MQRAGEGQEATVGEASRAGALGSPRPEPSGTSSPRGEPPTPRCHIFRTEAKDLRSLLCSSDREKVSYWASLSPLVARLADQLLMILMK